MLEGVEVKDEQADKAGVPIDTKRRELLLRARYVPPALIALGALATSRNALAVSPPDPPPF